MSTTNYHLELLKEEEIPQVVALFNKNNVYQFNSEKKITASDLLLTFKIKEMAHFFVLKYGKEIVGTTGFYHYVTVGAVRDNQCFSGFLLIDDKHRTGQAISTLNKEVFYKALDFIEGTQLTEIHKHNKASLSLSKRNGFLLTEESYEDHANCLLLKSPLLKLVKAHKKMSFENQTYDVSTFKLLENKSSGDVYETVFSVSDVTTRYKITDQNQYPHMIESEDIVAQLFERNQEVYLNYHFKEPTILHVSVSVASQVLEEKLELPQGSILLGNISDVDHVRVELYYPNNRRTLYLEPIIVKPLPLDDVLITEDFNGLQVSVNQRNGHTEFFFKGHKVFEDIFAAGDFRGELIFSVEKHQNEFVIIGENTLIKWEKRCQLTDHLSITYTLMKLDEPLKDVTAKFGLKIAHQNYWVKDENNQVYKKHVLWEWPLESDDFVAADKFNTLDKCYFLEELEAELVVSSAQQSATQFLMRPLFYQDLNTCHQLSYEIALINKKKGKILDFETNKAPLIASDRPVKHYNLTGLTSYVSETSRNALSHHKMNLTETKKVLMKTLQKTTLNQQIIEYGVPESGSIKGESIATEFNLAIYGPFDINMSQYKPVWQELKNHSIKHEFYQKISLFDRYHQQFVHIHLPNSYLFISRENNQLIIRAISKYATKHSLTIEYQESGNENE